MQGVNLTELVSSALAVGGEAIVRGGVTEATKDAYQALKGMVARLTSHVAAANGDAPGAAESGRELAVALDRATAVDQETIFALARELMERLDGASVGVDIGTLEASEVRLGAIDSVLGRGTGLRIRAAKVGGTFRTGDIGSVGKH